MNINPQDKKKLMLLIPLVTVALCLGLYNFMSSDDEESTPTTSTTRRQTDQAQTANAANTSNNKNALPIITTALDFSGVTSKAAEPGTGRNIFVYPPPPPPPTPTPAKPVPPPPVTLTGVAPGSAIAQTKGFEMTVFGAKIPVDAKVYLSGREYPSRFVSDTQLKVQVPATAIAAAGAYPIEVRSASDPKIYSNPVSFSVVQPPAPPYKYHGLIVKDGVQTAILKFDLEDSLVNVRKDQVVGRHWKVTRITNDEIEFIDTDIDVRHRIPYSGEGN
jgi:hypothetical protein